MTRLILPWPPKDLSPNSRVHWARKARAAKAYKKACHVIAKASGVKIDWDGEVYFWINFYPPDKRERDDDNLIAAFKAGRDGMAEALGIDDKRLKTKPWLSTDVVKGGSVVVRFSMGPEESNEVRK